MGDGRRKLLRVGIGLLKRESVFLCPDWLEAESGDTVIVARSYGIDYGEAIGAVEDTGQDVTESALRIATQDDFDAIEYTSPSPEDAEVFRKLATDSGLEMKLNGIDRSIDIQKMTFYYTADGRVDFRELVRRLTRAFGCRVELYQFNLEDQFKYFPTCGICGREVCCRLISGLFGMKVPSRACKDQKISYNPLKMAGCCGKARCCFKFEHVNYAEFADALPKPGGRLSYRGHEFKLSDWDVFSRTVLLWNPEAGREVAVPWDEFKIYFGRDSEYVEIEELIGKAENAAAQNGGAFIRKRGRELENEKAVEEDRKSDAIDSGGERRKPRRRRDGRRGGRR